MKNTKYNTMYKVLSHVIIHMWTHMTYPIHDDSSSLEPRASKMTSSLGNLWPAKLLEVPRQ